MPAKTRALRSVGTTYEIAKAAEDQRFVVRLQIRAAAVARANRQQANGGIHRGLLHLLIVGSHDHSDSKQPIGSKELNFMDHPLSTSNEGVL